MNLEETIGDSMRVMMFRMAGFLFLFLFSIYQKCWLVELSVKWTLDFFLRGISGSSIESLRKVDLFLFFHFLAWRILGPNWEL